MDHEIAHKPRDPRAVAPATSSMSFNPEWMLFLCVKLRNAGINVAHEPQ